jgi:membrane protease YdiL (CAAX protease family)
MRTGDKTRSLGAGQKVLVLGCAALAYASNFWPGTIWRREVFRLLGEPAYEGFQGLFLPHVLVYVTLTAICCAIAWLALVKARLLPPPSFALNRRVLILGALGGLAALMLSLAAVWFLFPAGTIHWIAPNAWKIGGTLFSNFYEEWIFRGFLLTALAAVLGFWPAALVSSALWAGMHPQFPLSMQAVLTIMGAGWCWLAREARSLWAPYASHMLLDVIADSLIG